MNRKIFFDHIRSRPFGGSLTNSQVDGIEAILDAAERYGWEDDRWIAYALATAWWETARTMQPIEEYGKGREHKYGRPTGPYNQRYYGRGYVQLTWLFNYEKASRELGVDFVKSPSKALIPEHAAAIMFKGMEQGWFTGKSLKHYFNHSTTDWKNARRIINGLDKWRTVAGAAKQFHAALEAAS